MSGLVLFGVGSRICVDIVETCRRNDQSIAAAIRNVPGPVYVDESVRVIDAPAVAPEIAALPFLLPLFGPGNRRTALAAATALGFQTPASLVDRTAIVASDCRIDPGVYVNAGCIIGGDSALERFVFCNRGASIGHHCRIGPFVSVGPSAVLSGSVTIGEGSMIGAGAIVLPTTSIGSGAVIAAGAVVGRDVPDGGFAAGNPARIRLAGG